MFTALAFALGLAATEPAAPVSVLVVVPLCDGAKLACGNGTLGDPHDPEQNLYWGALYGNERFLRKQARFAFDKPASTATAPILRDLSLVRKAARGERVVKVRMVAFDGEHIDAALAFFLDEVRAGAFDLVVWAGHDRLMDVEAPKVTKSERARDVPVNVAVLACISETYFGPVIDAAGARSVALTKSLMGPEGYLLAALLDNVARHGPAERAHLREALVGAYARYQKISQRAAGTVFSKLE